MGLPEVRRMGSFCAPRPVCQAPEQLRLAKYSGSACRPSRACPGSARAGEDEPSAPSRAERPQYRRHRRRDRRRAVGPRRFGRLPIRRHRRGQPTPTCLTWACAAGPNGGPGIVDRHRHAGRTGRRERYLHHLADGAGLKAYLGSGAPSAPPGQLTAGLSVAQVLPALAAQ